MLIRLAEWCYRKRRLVVLLWVLMLVGTLALSSTAGGEFRQDYLQPGSESEKAVDLLKERFPAKSGDVVQVVFRAPAGVTSPQARAAIESVLTDASSAKHVVGVVSPFGPEGAQQISRDGTIAYADVELDTIATDMTPEEAKELISGIRKKESKDLTIEAGGLVASRSVEGEVGSEGLGFMAAALILLVTFGSVVAMGLPLLTALFGISISVAIGTLLRHVVPVPDWAPSVAQMVGIGVGIDYALFIVTRFRGSLADGQEPQHAVRTAIATAGRAVLFAGMTVVVSMLGMLLMNQSYTAGVAFSTVLAVLVIMAASVTLLPALLGFAGRGIERLHVPFVGRTQRAYDRSFWFRWSRFIQRRPWPAAIGGLVVLLALSAPFLGIRFGFPDAGNDPKSFTTRRAYALLEQGFGTGFNGPILLTTELARPGDLAPATALVEKLRTIDGVQAVTPAIPNNTRIEAADTAVITVFATTSPQDEETERLVDRLRKTDIPAAVGDSGMKVHVGGIVASNIDSTRGVTDKLPLFIGAVTLLSFLLLMVVFRSILVPLKAAVMNLLSITAAYGVMALAVNGGPLGDLIGIPEATPVPSFIPMIMFAILFGLSMDYEVFLLSRIREEYQRTGDNGLAVADGLARTARVITAAALIMITVFLAFVQSPSVFLKMLGIGSAAAVLVDATIVRMVLVPATMQLLGDRNWWLPGWLDRLLPNVHIEGSEPDVDLREEIIGQRTGADMLTQSEV